MNDHISALQLKEQGNKQFNDGSYEESICLYTKGLSLAEDDNSKSVLYKNRAAAFLKLNEYKKAVDDCTEVLKISPNDTKALFRRCQALEQLEKFDEAYKDAKQLYHFDPKNTAVKPYLARLYTKIQEVAEKQSNTLNRIEQMFQYAFDGEKVDSEKRLQAINNLIILARDNAGADVMFKEGIVAKILRVMKTEKNPDFATGCMRIFGELCKKNVPRTKDILCQLSVPQIIEGVNSKSETQVNAALLSIQTILETLAGMDRKENLKPDKRLLRENALELAAIMKVIVHNISSRTMSALGRDSLLEILMKNADYETLHWGEKILETDGIQRILEVASELQDYKYESSMEVTENTQSIVASTIERIYNSLSADVYRDQFRNKVDEFVKEKLKGPDVEPKVRVTAAITTLLQGALDVGNYCIAQQGILEMMLVMAGTDDVIQQRVAAEALVAAATKKDKCASIITQGVDILKKLYNSNNDGIRVRALVGLCKLSSYGGTDAAIRPFSDGSAQKLSLACRKFLTNPKKDRDLRKWSAEGLSYLTLDADIKEELLADKTAMLALIELAKVGSLSVLYGVVTTFVNLCNCYEKQEIIPEMVQLAKFAKQHIPEEHEKDSEEYVKKRIQILTNMGITTALVILSKTESRSSRELIARVFNAICEDKDLRGIVVQQGGAKALIPLALDGTDKGKHIAAQALSRIAISMNPEVAFPGQRSAEIVRPIIKLLHPDCSGLQNFEALMALCNLAHIGPTIRNRIVKDSGLPQIEIYWYEDHDMLKRAATQCLVNMIASDRYMELLEGKNDRVKYWTLLCMDEDLETAKAASGGLAMMTEISKKCCKKVFEAQAWLDSLRYLLANEQYDLQYRGICIVYNLMHASQFVAKRLIETDLMELLMALMKIEDPKSSKLVDLADKSLKRAAEWNLIKAIEEDDDDDD